MKMMIAIGRHEGYFDNTNSVRNIPRLVQPIFQLKMTSSKSPGTRAATLAILLAMTALAQTNREPAPANLCEIFSSPARYNHKAVTVEGVLSPSIHSLFLSIPECDTKADIDFTAQAILPASWESLPHGKELRRYLHRGKSATVRLTGTFEADPQRYGPDGLGSGLLSTESPLWEPPHQASVSNALRLLKPILVKDLAESARRNASTRKAASRAAGPASQSNATCAPQGCCRNPSPLSAA
jgi:hypothetical protein